MGSPALETPCKVPAKSRGFLQPICDGNLNRRLCRVLCTVLCCGALQVLALLGRQDQTIPKSLARISILAEGTHQVV